MSATPVDVPDDFFAALRRLFSEREVVELTAHVAHEKLQRAVQSAAACGGE